MGQIDENRKKRKEKRRSDNDPLSGELGDRDVETNDFDIDEKNIKDQQNKKQWAKGIKRLKEVKFPLEALESSGLKGKSLM